MPCVVCCRPIHPPTVLVDMVHEASTAPRDRVSRGDTRHGGYDVKLHGESCFGLGKWDDEASSIQLGRRAQRDGRGHGREQQHCYVSSAPPIPKQWPNRWAVGLEHLPGNRSLTNGRANFSGLQTSVSSELERSVLSFFEKKPIWSGLVGIQIGHSPAFVSPALVT